MRGRENYNSRLWRETQNMTPSSYFDFLLSPKLKLSQLYAFSVAPLVSLTHSSCTLFLNF